MLYSLLSHNNNDVISVFNCIVVTVTTVAWYVLHHTLLDLSAIVLCAWLSSGGALEVSANVLVAV